MRLSGLAVYPVKSLRGIAVEAWEVDERGFEGDRRWMAVDAEGRFVTQRTHPAMALVRAAIRESRLILEAPGQTPFHLTSGGRGTKVEATVWDDRCDAVDCGDEAAEWLSRAIGTACRLVRMDEEFRRRVDPGRVREEAVVGFADAYPFLLATEASLEDLNGRLETPVSMERFRPNLVVAGTGAYEEDRWKVVRIGGITFDVVKPCSRCAIVTVDPETGLRGPEPLRTLAGYRGEGDKVLFGQNLVHRGPGRLREGDEVEVLERREGGGPGRT
jgi:hypothetical protein